MQLFPVLGNHQKLDGGAMFGNVPKALWQQWITPDQQNRIDLACRGLLVKTQGKNILLETGIGAFFPEKLRQRYGIVESHHVLLDSLRTLGCPEAEIDIVILSHLHFDHAGGLLSTYQKDKGPELIFPNAQFIISDKAWQRAINPHPRDKASFIPQLQPLLEQSGRLHLQQQSTCSLLGENFKFHFNDGHTQGMMLTEIKTEQGPLLFAADLIPGIPWVHLPVTMGYDRAPELLIDEKLEILSYLVNTQGRLFYTHDKDFAVSEIEKDETGKFIVKNPSNILI